MSYLAVQKCRVCSNTDLKKVFDLGNQPLSNDHCFPGEPRQGFYPLAILYCDKCGLAQLSAVVDKSILYAKYSYVSSTSETMRNHYHRLLKDIQAENVYPSVVEIGSNTGDLLRFMSDVGYFGIFGIEPAENLVAIARKQIVPTINDFFNVSTAKEAKSYFEEIQPGVILARHCFAHMDDWHEFIEALGVLSGVGTLTCIEFPYAKNTIERVELDQVYHEHLSFISIRPLVKLLKNTPFHIHRINSYEIHGGAVMVMIRHNDSKVAPHSSVQEYLANENITEDSWKQFAIAAQNKIHNLRVAVIKLVKEGKTVSAFGASAKSTVLLNACHFTNKEIKFVSDNTPFKIGRLIPGTDIPIIDESQMEIENPDYAIMTCWNFKAECIAKMKSWTDKGGHWIIPDKEIEIV